MVIVKVLNVRPVEDFELVSLADLLQGVIGQFLLRRVRFSEIIRVQVSAAAFHRR